MEGLLLFYTSADATESAPFLIAIGAIVMVGIVVAVIRSRAAAASSGGTGRSSGGAGFGKWRFRSLAKRLGYGPVQVDFLEYFARRLSLGAPEFALQNPAALDKFLKRVFQEIESSTDSDKVAEDRKAILFSIRDTAENAKAQGHKIRSTRQVSDGTSLSVQTGDGENHPSRFLTVSNDALAIATPLDALGEEMRLKKGTRIACTFYAKNGQGYSFPSKVLGYEARKNASAMLIIHSDSVAALPNRRFKRKDLDAPCYFHFVEMVVTVEHRKQVKQAVVEQRRVMGTIVEISAGGCSVKTSNPLAQGDYLKIEFDMDGGSTAAVLGKVVKLNRPGGIGGIMHIQFSRSSRKTLNQIRSYVYGYGA